MIAARVILSAIYGVDLAIRAKMSGRILPFLRTHPANLAAVVVPPLRVTFCVQLLRSVFRRGELRRFLIAEGIAIANAAAIVWLAKRHAPNANIHTLPESLWWAVVTVTTVGYGDFYPVSTLGRLSVAAIMATGVITFAVLTAQIAANFNDHTNSRRARAPKAGFDRGDAESLRVRLERIEAKLDELTSTAQGQVRQPLED